MGAGGNTQVSLDRDGRCDGSWDLRDDQPAGVSPSPCRKIKAAGLAWLDFGTEDPILVDMARMEERRRKEDDRIISFGRRWAVSKNCIVWWWCLLKNMLENVVYIIQHYPVVLYMISSLSQWNHGTM